MDDIDPTPRRPQRSFPSKPPVLDDIDATPRRVSPPRQVRAVPMEDIDATPRRPIRSTPVNLAPIDKVEPPPQQISIPGIVGPGRVNKAIPLSMLPALETLTSPPLLEKKSSPPEPGESEKTIDQPEKLQAQQGTRPIRKKQAWLSRKAPASPDTKTRRIREKRAPASTKLRKKRRRRHWLAWLLISVLLLALLIGGGISYSFYLIETNLLRPLAQFFHPVSGSNEGAIDGRAWNLLLLGSDNDHKFSYPELLTQVMMVVRVDPYNNKISMVSIPRDSWVPVPGKVGVHKIDQAFYLGATVHRSFDDGVRLARATIERDYGISIDRYAWIGLEGFASVINTLGGVDIDLRHPLLDDNYPDDTNQGKNSHTPYALKRIYLFPGPQHLSGDEALEYVRSRHADLVGDIGRTQRQQEVLQALKQKLNVSTIFNNLDELFRDLKGRVYTDLSEDELLSLGTFLRDLPPQAISRVTLGPGYGKQNYGTLTRLLDTSMGEIQDVVLPNCTNIQPLLNTIFHLGNAQSCQANTP